MGRPLWRPPPGSPDNPSPPATCHPTTTTTARRDLDSSLLTLDEFLRETSAASFARDESERILQRSHRQPPPQQLQDHTPAGRARLLAAETGDSFDTLVGQIRRIGALQDLMLGVPAAADAGVVGEEAVASLRAREARLRAMQGRIELLTSEFALLRNTRRELRRVEAEALETLQSANHARGGTDGERLPGWRSQAAERYVIGRRSLLPTVAGTRELQSAVPGVVLMVPDRREEMTRSERDRAMRSAVMRMQIERLPTGV